MSGMYAAVGARLSGLYVMPEYVPPVYLEAAAYMPDMSPRRFREEAEKEAAAALIKVAKAGDDAGVPARMVKTTHAHPWTGIINTARSKKCDLIVMASHGRRGLAGLLLGSETTKVLTHSKVPVLVVR
jgi:nucleotide-binding universal stress UspA family protein